MDKEKHVDESWKEQASQEKDVLADAATSQSGQEQKVVDEPVAEESSQPSEQQPDAAVEGNEETQAMEINFLNYITSLGFQAMIFMGEIPNPVSNKVEKNLVQAKFIIDTLSLLKEKTVGNLNDQEKNLLESSVYELQLKYVQISSAETSAEESPAA